MQCPVFGFEVWGRVSGFGFWVWGFSNLEGEALGGPACRREVGPLLAAAQLPRHPPDLPALVPRDANHAGGPELASERGRGVNAG